MKAVSLFCACTVVLWFAASGQVVADTPAKSHVETDVAGSLVESSTMTYAPGTQPQTALVPATGATPFEEVEIMLDGSFSLADIQALPQAPDGPFKQLSDPARVVLQLPAEVVLGLRKQGADVRTIRTFVLVQPSDAVPTDGRGEVAAVCSGVNRSGQNSTIVWIPDADGWVRSPISITGAPAGSVVSCIDVHYEIIHTWIADLDVDLNDANLTYNYDLWGPGQGIGEDLNQTVTGITTFNGEFANQEWDLWARDVATIDIGYIAYWWIKVYYTTSALQPDLLVNTSSRSPETGVAPGGTVNLADTIANTGNAAAGGPFRAMWFISVDANVTTSDYAWAYHDVACCLASGGTASAAGGVTWPNIAPYNTPGQTYYIAVMADSGSEVSESNEANNLGQVWPVTLCSLPPPPSGPVPADNATNIPQTVELCWNAQTQLAKIIYGNDDRKDIYQVSDPGLLSAADGTVALVDTMTLINNGNGTYSLPGTPVLRDYIEWLTSPFYYPPCPGERFISQPIPAFCSGALVAPDLIVTAGHCITNASDCANTAFVFGFDMTSATTPTLTFPQADVYFCSAIVSRAQVNGGPDWGVIRLDRAVTGHVPLPIRCAGKVPDAQPLTLIGHPVGLPTKIAGGAAVRDNTLPGNFLANVDAYAGNSGSAVINTTTGSPTIEGLLVSGNADWVYDSVNQCTKSNWCPDTGCAGTSSPWDGATRTTEFAGLVPACTAPQYNVYFGACGSMGLVRTGGTETCWSPPTLQGCTRYCWQVVSHDNCGVSPGPAWSFTTHYTVDSADPPNCAIDARQPYPPNTPGLPQGWNSVALTFGTGCSVSGVTPGDFTVSCNPAGPPCPTITGVTPVGQTVTVRLSGVIPAGKWTCITHNSSGEQVCIGSLPADANGDRTSAPVDILEIIDNLNLVRVPPLTINQCDIDRSNLCAPADILSEIDLLNGANGFLVWNGRNLPVCPSAP